MRDEDNVIQYTDVMDRMRRFSFCLYTIIFPVFIFSGIANAGKGFQVPADTSHAWYAFLAPESLLVSVIKKNGRLLAAGERGHILFSEDAVNWQQASVPVQILLTGVYMSDSIHGWAVGHDAVILNSVDGGKSWRKIHEAVEEQRPLLDVWFRDNGYGIVIGAYGYLLHTHDSGITWESNLVNEEHDFHLNAISATPQGKLYIAAEAGYVYRSDDDGASWATLNPPYEGSFFGVISPDEDKVVVFGLRGNVFVSNDSGESWRRIDSETQSTLTSGIKLKNGYFVISGHAGTLLLSDPNLNQVFAHQIPDRKALSDLVEVSPNQLVLVGEDGAKKIDLCQTFRIVNLPGCRVQ
ncbi:MAG: hypothetical protein EP297_05010 [Gammaproteobacteria bacterium]|nr:MAG: hypothetical protein EP297_05010 [Gammaproteobacteria bacterium]